MKVNKIIIIALIVVGFAMTPNVISPVEAKVEFQPKLTAMAPIGDITKIPVEDSKDTILQQPLKRKKAVVPKPRLAAVAVSRDGATSTRAGKTYTVTATGYCSCSKCCGPYDGTKTASGTRVHWGTVAADTRIFPFGTRLTINGHYPGTVFTVEDRGGAVKGNKIDIWFSSHSEALKWGRRTITITLQ